MTDAWRNHYDRWRLASPPENDPCPCGGDWETDVIDGTVRCSDCGKSEQDWEDGAEDAAIERAEREREDRMFDDADKYDWR